jgi:hypothetical protein
MAIGTLELLLVNAKGLGDNDFLGIIFTYIFSFFFSFFPLFAGISKLDTKDHAALWNGKLYIVFSMIAFMIHQADSWVSSNCCLFHS